MKLVGAALGLDTEHAAHRPAEFRLVSGGLQLKLLDGLNAQVLIVEAVIHARGVDSIDVEDVLSARRAVDRNAAHGPPLMRDIAGQCFDVHAWRVA